MSQTCSKCSAVAPADAIYCGACGSALQQRDFPPPSSTGQAVPTPERTPQPTPQPAPQPPPAADGTNAGSEPGPKSVTINVPPALTRLHRSIAGDNATVEVPVYLWAAVAMLGLAGIFVVIPAIRALPDTLDLLGQGSFGRTFGLFLTVLLLLMISFGVACFYLAAKLLQADRAGRILTIVLAGSLGMGLLIADGKGTAEVVTILGCAGVIAILTLVEEVTTFFTGPHAVQSDVATSVIAARSMVIALSWVLGATGIAFLPLGDLQGRFVFIGLIMVGVAAVAFKYAGELLTGDENARYIITGLMIAYIIAILATEPEGASLFIPIGLTGSVIALLWIPEDARQHFEPGRSPAAP